MYVSKDSMWRKILKSLWEKLNKALSYSCSLISLSRSTGLNDWLVTNSSTRLTSAQERVSRSWSSFSCAHVLSGNSPAPQTSQVQFQNFSTQAAGPVSGTSLAGKWKLLHYCSSLQHCRCKFPLQFTSQSQAASQFAETSSQIRKATT